MFSRSITGSAGNGTIKKGQRAQFAYYVSTTKTSTIADYGVNAINILIKFEAGLELEDEVIEKSPGVYSGDVNYLYGVKPDRTGWKDEVELNHTQDYELVYYDTLEEAKKQGPVVAALVEMRGGIWLRDTIRYDCVFRAIGDSGQSYVTVQDVKMWRGSGDLYETSWVGTNGNTVNQTQGPIDFMKPYDNPANTEGSVEQRVYRRDTWPDGAAEPQQVEGPTWGDTVYILGGELKVIRDSSVNLNGISSSLVHGPWNDWWSNSTFNTTLNQRYVDRQFAFEVSGVGEKNISLQAEINISNYYDKNLYTEQRGSVYLSTEANPVKYIPNADPAMPGRFEGGVVIDPSNFTVPGDGTYALYYTSFIGNIEDLSKDAPMGIWWDQTSLNIVGTSVRDVYRSSGTIVYTVTVVLCQDLAQVKMRNLSSS